MEGVAPRISQNPLIGVLYGATYLPVQNSPYWLIHSATLARLALFALLWSGAMLVARKLGNVKRLELTALLLLVTPCLWLILENSSDALFAAMACYAFYFLLRHKESAGRRDLLFSSVFVALSALSRNDGFVLFAVFMALAIFMNLKPKEMLRRVGLAAAPFAVIIGGYALFFGAASGDFEFGVGKRTYTAFEQGHGAANASLYQARGLNPYFEGTKVARRVFGTPEENNYSVFRAIKRSPKGYFSRLAGVLGRLPQMAISVYGGQKALVWFLLAAFGVASLILAKKGFALAAIWLWPAHLGVYVLTFYRVGYFLLPFYLVLGLAALGAGKIVDREKGAMPRMAFLALAAASCSIELILDKQPLALLALAALCFVAAVWLLQKWLNEGAVPVVVLVVLVAFVAAQSGQIKNRTLGVEPDEIASVYMAEHFGADARIAAYTPGNIFFARKTFVPIYRASEGLKTKEDLKRWLIEEKIDAVYVNESFRKYESKLWKLVERSIGEVLETAWGGEDDGVAVLVPKVAQPTE